jgi:hypothetical protein
MSTATLSPCVHVVCGCQPASQLASQRLSTPRPPPSGWTLEHELVLRDGEVHLLHGALGRQVHDQRVAAAVRALAQLVPRLRPAAAAAAAAATALLKPPGGRALSQRGGRRCLLLTRRARIAIGTAIQCTRRNDSPASPLPAAAACPARTGTALPSRPSSASSTCSQACMRGCTAVSSRRPADTLAATRPQSSCCAPTDSQRAEG